MPTVGYSGVPLARKLGIKPASRICTIGAPDNYAEMLSPLPEGVRFERRPDSLTDIAHIFTTHKEELSRHLCHLREKLNIEATIWVSWPKKASRIPTTVTDDTVRELALPLGLVDVKVCAVTEVWSGLKLVVRKELRCRPAHKDARNA
jgi:Protein of unknown function (DUF3052)